VVPSRISSKSPWLLPAAVTLSIVFFILAGCEGDRATRPDSSGDSPYTIPTMQVSQTSLAAGDSSVVSARVVGPDRVTPAAGKEVRFGESAGKRSGTYLAEVGVTDADGWARTIFVADVGGSGMATLKASVGEAVAYATVNLIGATDDGLLLTLSSPGGATALIADGASALSLRLNATQGSERTGVAGLAVRLTAGDRFDDRNGDGVYGSGDVLIPAGDSNGNGTWDALGSVPATVVTDASGNAEFTLHGSMTVGTTWVRATAMGKSTDLAIQFHPTALMVVIHRPTARELLSDGLSTTEIVAEVTDYVGNPIQGVIVRFTAGEPFEDLDGDGEFTMGRDPFTDWNGNGRWDVRGTIESFAPSDPDGLARVNYTAGLDAGEVRIRATVSGGSAESSLWLVTVPTAARIEIGGERAAVFADGRSPIGGTLTVWDVNGTPLPGKQVRLVAGEPFEDRNHDGLFTQGTDRLIDDIDGNGTWTQIGTIPSTVVTGAGGTASFTYRAGLLPGAVVVKATADQSSSDLTLNLRPLPTVASLTVASELPEIQVRGGGGVDNVLITAKCFDALGDTIPSGLVVEFSVMNGPRSGEELVNAVGGMYRTRTEDAGQARAVLVAGSVPGIIEVAVTAGIVTRTVQVGVAAGTASDLQLDAVDKILDFWSETEVTAFVSDRYGNPVRDGVIVLFSVDKGVIEGESGLASSQTAHGQAKATYRSLGPSLDSNFRATIRAQVQGLTTAGTMEIQLNEAPPPPIASVQLTTDRSRIEVRRPGEIASTAVVARGFTVEGNPVGAGYAVTIWIGSGPKGGESLDGEGWGPITALTNQDGIAQATLESGTLPGPIQVQAQSGTAAIVSAEVQVIAGPPVEMVCFGDPEQISANETSVISAYLYDVYHNPVQDGVLVSFRVDEGMIEGDVSPSSSRTEGGVAQATYYSLTPQAGGDGIAVVACVAEGGSLTCETQIAIPNSEQEPLSISVSAADFEIAVGGTGAKEQTTLVATPHGRLGGILGAGIGVVFTITNGPGGGEQLNGQGTTTSVVTGTDGSARATLTAGTRSGTVTLQAMAGSHASSSTVVAITAGPPAFLTCTAPDSMACDSWTTGNAVRAYVTDIHRNPVRDGTAVWFSADMGLIVGTDALGSSATVNGIAIATYWAPLGTECDIWTDATLTFRCLDLSCTAVVSQTGALAP
jgi:hypothetical protein